jgi:hypothetical protein
MKPRIITLFAVPITLFAVPVAVTLAFDACRERACAGDTDVNLLGASTVSG